MMDIHECHDRYRITLKKLRLMHRDGVLRIEKEKTPEYWIKLVKDIKRGRMSARSIALAFRYPEKLAQIHYLTRADRRVLDAHFKSVELPTDDLKLSVRPTISIGAAQKHPMLMSEFIETVQKIIPSHDVSYYYIAVRLYIACDTDFRMNIMSEYMTRAFSSIRDEPLMQGWWHHEPSEYGKNRAVYHRPRHYDL